MSLKICDQCDGKRVLTEGRLLPITEYCSKCKGVGLIEVEDTISPEELNQIYKAKEAQARQLHACDKKKQAHMLMCRFNTAATGTAPRGNKGKCKIDNNKECIGQCLHDRNKLIKGVDGEWVLMR